MVNSVSALNTASKAIKNTTKQKAENAKVLIKYLNGEVIKEVPDTFVSSTKSAGSSALLWEGLPFIKFLKNNKKLNNSFINDSMKNLTNNNKAALKNIFKGEGKLSERILNYISTANNSKKVYSDIKSYAKAESKIQKLTKGLDEAAKASKIENSGKLTKLIEKSKNVKEAIETAGKVAENGGKAAGKLGKFGKFFKSSGAGFMLALSGIIEAATEVVPTFKELGAKKGIKQAGKSAVKVAGDTFGFIAGEQVGTAVGTAIGTAIFPGVGTAIGAAVGFIGGMLGSFAMGKLTKAVTGKSEREKVQEQQEQQQAQEIANNDELYNELKNEAEAKIKEEAEANGGELSDDANTVLSLLDEADNASNPFKASV